MKVSHLLRGKSDPFDVLAEATLTELPERQHEEGPRGGISGKKQLCDNRGNMCRAVIGSKGVFLAGSSRKHRENRLQRDPKYNGRHP